MKLAIDGGEKTREAAWPAWPMWDSAEERAILDVLHSGQWWSVGGARVREFEEAFAVFQQGKHAVCVTNGTAALVVALRALGIGLGDEVIVPPYTFIATASSVLAVGATPVFADIQPESYTLDPAAVEGAVTGRTRALIPVHIAGQPADMDGLMAVAGRHGLAVIEDAAQAHAAEWKGRRVGAIGSCGTFSFQASKNLNSGEGGALLTDDDELADKIWSVHNVGRTRSGRWYEHHALGGNERMTEWQAAILLAQLQRLSDQACRRSENASYLSHRLAEIPGISPLPRDPRVTQHAYHLYMFRYDPASFGGRPREEFLRALSAEGIGCSGGYSPLYREPVFQRSTLERAPWGRGLTFREYEAVDCPVCERVCREAVWLTQNMLLGPREDMDDVANAVEKIKQAWSE